MCNTIMNEGFEQTSVNVRSHRFQFWFFFILTCTLLKLVWYADNDLSCATVSIQ